MSIERDLLLEVKQVDPDDYDLFIRELKRFLALAAVSSDTPIVPSQVVDKLWHQFIIDTKRYMEFCDRVYGHYLHHEPERTNSLTRARNQGEAFARTKELYRKTFGEWPPSVWGVSAGCDGSACRAIPWCSTGSA